MPRAGELGGDDRHLARRRTHDHAHVGLVGAHMGERVHVQQHLAARRSPRRWTASRRRCSAAARTAWRTPPAAAATGGSSARAAGRRARGRPRRGPRGPRARRWRACAGDAVWLTPSSARPPSGLRAWAATVAHQQSSSEPSPAWARARRRPRRSSPGRVRAARRCCWPGAAGRASPSRACSDARDRRAARRRRPACPRPSPPGR